MDEDNSDSTGNGENTGYMGEHDPYRSMESAQGNITPGFLGGKGGGESPSGLKEKNNDAKNTLKDAEDGASQHWTEDGKHIDLGNGRFYEPDEDELKNLRSKEESGGGFYSGNKAKKGKGKKRGRFSLKKSGPMFGIFGLIIGIGGFMGGMQSMMPIAIEEMILEKLNSVGIASTITSDEWFNDQLNNSLESRYKPSDCDTDLYGFSDYQVDQFKQHGIYAVKPEVTANEGLSNITALLFLKNDVFIPVIGSDFYDDASFNNDALVESLKQKAGVDNIGKPMSAPDALNDKTFKKLYIAATKSWRGGTSGWFDKIMKNVTEAKLNITRSRWTKYATTSLKAISKKQFKKIASLKGNEKVKSTSVNDEGQGDFAVVQQTDEDGNPIGQTGEPINTGDDNPELKAGDAKNREKLRGVLESKGMKAAKAASKVADIACNVASAAMVIYGVVSGYQALQFLNLTSGFLESVDRVKKGEVDSSPMNEYANELTTGRATMVSDEEGKESVAPGKENTSGMASMGMSWLFDNDNVSGEDASVDNVNFESIMNRITGLSDVGAVATSVLSYCGYVHLASQMFDLVTDIISICTLGIGSVVKAFVEVAVSASIAMAVGPLVSKLVGYALTEVANLLIKDAATEWFGEDLGNALVSGAGRYLGGNGTSHGLGLGDTKKTAAYRREQNAVIAEEAEYQRSIRSPFDMTSKYTFLGSMAYAMIPIAYSGSGVMSMLRQASSMTTNAITQLLPTAEAVSENKGLTTKECQILNGIGAVGDIFCNPYVIIDTTITDLSYNDISAIVHGERSSQELLAAMDVPESSREAFNNNFEDCKIKDDSNLAKYITYCGERTSQYGIYDATIMEQIQSPTQKVSSLISTTNVPIVSSIAGIVGAGIEQENAPWINGSACVASDDSSVNPKWRTEYSLYQGYVNAESERSLMDPTYDSELNAFIERQHEKNPIDQSLEGTIARFSGMTKEDVELGLNLIEYYQFLEEYDPSTRYAFGAPAVEEPAPNYDNENVLAGDVIMPERILYADIRNRTFVV